MLKEVGETLGEGPGPARRVRGPSLDERSILLGGQRSSGWGGVTVSVVVHLMMFGGAWAYANYTPPRVVPEKPIVAKLVRLGKPRDEKLLPRLPATPKAPPPEAKAAPVPVPVAEPVPAPSPTAKAAPAVTPQPKVDPAAAEKERQRRMMEALSRVTPTSGPTSDRGETELPGQLDGDAQGTAEDAAEGDRYLALLEQAIRSNYVLPTTISQKERLFLACTLFIRIAADGKVTSFKILESSGNAQFDRAVEGSLQRTVLPAPPKTFLAMYGEGLEIRFKP